MPKVKKLFSIPKWDDGLPDLSKQFKVKEVPFLVDKKKKQEEIEQRKKLKAKRTLKKQASEPESQPTTSLKPGMFVRAPPPDYEDMEDDDGLNPLQMGKGLKRQLSDDEDGSDGEPRPQLAKRNVIAPSSFNKSATEIATPMEDEQSEWKTVKGKNKKKLKVAAMDTDEPSAKLEFKKSNDFINSSTVNSSSSSNPFRNRLVESLKGSRFRFINEQLYKCEGKDALKLFEEDRDAFIAYHDGYRQQVERWPRNPLDRMIKAIKKMPINTVVADFGCGEARLGQEVPQEVKSLDLIAINPDVIACDMASTPLKDDSVDVAVFCLSLMGTNLKDFFLEANRVLKPRGTLKIAEVASRFDNVKSFTQSVEKCGFQMVNQDLGDKLFYYFNFKKTGKISKSSKEVKEFSLKPCLYKKR